MIIDRNLILNVHVRVLLFVDYGYTSNNFVVGLTDVHPLTSKPTLFNYTVCGRYPGIVHNAATVSLYCQDNLPPFRYVIVQFPRNNMWTSFCELEVIAIGMK